MNTHSTHTHIYIYLFPSDQFRSILWCLNILYVFFFGNFIHSVRVCKVGWLPDFLYFAVTFCYCVFVIIRLLCCANHMITVSRAIKRHRQRQWKRQKPFKLCRCCTPSYGVRNTYLWLYRNRYMDFMIFGYYYYWCLFVF